MTNKIYWNSLKMTNANVRAASSICGQHSNVVRSSVFAPFFGIRGEYSNI